MAAEISHHTVAGLLSMALNGMADIAQAGTGLDGFNSLPHGLVDGFDQLAGRRRYISDQIHLGGVRNIAAILEGDIQIEDGTGLQLDVVRTAMTGNLVQ